jgi:hypothetical protein
MMVERISVDLFGASPGERSKRRRRVPLRYECYEGTEAALDWATGKLWSDGGKGHSALPLLLAYGGRCTVTGCAVREALEASHIVPYDGEPNDSPENGLLAARGSAPAIRRRAYDGERGHPTGDARPDAKEGGSGHEKLHDKPLRRVQRGHRPPSRDALRRQGRLRPQAQNVAH